jgi:hypothetical protein
MPATAAAYKRYLEKFDQRDTQIEKLQGVEWQDAPEDFDE